MRSLRGAECETDGSWGLTSAAEVFAVWRGRDCLVFFVLYAHIASVSAIFLCGLALTTWRNRQPLRLSPSAMGLGAGHGLALSPWRSSVGTPAWYKTSDLA